MVIRLDDFSSLVHRNIDDEIADRIDERLRENGRRQSAPNGWVRRRIEPRTYGRPRRPRRRERAPSAARCLRRQIRIRRKVGLLADREPKVCADRMTVRVFPCSRKATNVPLDNAGGNEIAKAFEHLFSPLAKLSCNVDAPTPLV